MKKLKQFLLELHDTALIFFMLVTFIAIIFFIAEKMSYLQQPISQI